MASLGKAEGSDYKMDLLVSTVLVRMLDVWFLEWVDPRPRRDLFSLIKAPLAPPATAPKENVSPFHPQIRP